MLPSILLDSLVGRLVGVLFCRLKVISVCNLVCSLFGRLKVGCCVGS